MRVRPSPVSLRSPPSPAVRERGYDAFSTKPLSRTAGEGGPNPKGLVGEGSAAFSRSGGDGAERSEAGEGSVVSTREK